MLIRALLVGDFAAFGLTTSKDWFNSNSSVWPESWNKIFFLKNSIGNKQWLEPENSELLAISTLLLDLEPPGRYESAGVRRVAGVNPKPTEHIRRVSRFRIQDSGFKIQDSRFKSGAEEIVKANEI